MAALGQVPDGGAVASALVDQVRGLGVTAEEAMVQEGRAAASEMDDVRDAGAMDQVRDLLGVTAEDEVRDGRVATSAVEDVRGRRTAASALVEQVREGKKPKTVRDLAFILRYLVDGGEAPNHVHEENVYSDGPENLAQGRQHAFRATGRGSQMVWLFYTRTPLANDKNRRPRKVGGNEEGTWHGEKDEPDITGADHGEPAVLGYMKRFSYRLKNPSGGRGIHTGWSMFQISLHKHGDEKVLCMLCKSNHKPKISTATSSGAGAETPLGEEDLPRLDQFLHTPGGGNMSSPAAQVPAAPMPAFAITTTFKLSVEEVQDTGAASTGKSLVDVEEAAAAGSGGGLTVVMALDESSIPSAQRFKVMIEHILSLTQDRPPVVLLLSATGGTHTNIEQAVRRALMLRCGEEASEMHEVAAIKELYLGTVHELGLDSAIVTGPLIRLEEHLQSILVTKDLTPTAQDYLASFGQRISATIFCAYLKDHGKNIHQVWRDAHGVLTRDPSIIFTNVLSFTYFSLHDAIELACSGAQGMNPGSMSSVVDDGIPVIIVKNPWNPQARGKQERDFNKHKLSSIVLRPNIVMLDIARTGDPSQRDFLAQVSSIFEDSGIYVDLDASRGNIFLTLDPSNLGGCELSHQEIVNLVEKVKEIAVVQPEHISIISLVGNEHESTPILAKVIGVLTSIGVHAKKVSQRSSKVITVTLVVDNSEAKDCVRALHSAFFENGFVSQGADQKLNSFPVQVPESSQAAAARSGDKRKADGHHPEAPPGVRQERAETARNGRDETEPRLFSTNDSTTIGGEGDPPDEALDDFFQRCIDSTGIEPVRVDVSAVLAEQANDIALSDFQRLLFTEEDPVLVGGIFSDKDSDREWARLLLQPEQQVLDEAAVSDDRLRTGTEVLLEEFSPEELLGPSNAGMSCPSPPPFLPS